MVRSGLGVAVVLLAPAAARAGLYYSGETVAELPSRWAGFLLDHRNLRDAAVDRPAGLPPSPLRAEYRAAAAKLERAAKARPLTADEAADLGALLVRLGQPGQAVSVLRPAARAHPDHFRLAANLGTAWQLAGDLDAAAAARDEAARLAPEGLKRYEEYHRKLVVLRLAEGKAARVPDAPDALFGPKLPDDAAAVVQHLALALPQDGRVLWLVAEAADALGDPRTAAAILDGCATAYRMTGPNLLARRRAARAAADALAAKPDHDRHRDRLAAKSVRPLVRRFDVSALPPVSADRPNPAPWGLLAETALGGQDGPAFPARLAELDGKPVVLTGFVQPPGTEAEFAGFLLLEFPVGCWFCETPDPTGIARVELEPGTTTGPRRGLVKVTGTLRLNRDDPEDFPFRVVGGRVAEPE
jgi:tetratricopeptide (TPR) repeat protein